MLTHNHPNTEKIDQDYKFYKIEVINKKIDSVIRDKRKQIRIQITHSTTRRIDDIETCVTDEKHCHEAIHNYRKKLEDYGGGDLLVKKENGKILITAIYKETFRS